MQLTKLLRRELWGNPVLKALYLAYMLVFIGVQAYFFSYVIRDPTSIIFLSIALQFILVHFIFVLFFSYEFCIMTESTHFSECAASIYIGKARLYGAKLLVLLQYLALPLLLMLLLHCAVTVRQSFDFAYLWHAAKHMLLNYLLLPLCGMLIAAALSLRYKRTVAYLCLLLLAVLFSPFTEVLASLLYRQSGINTNLFRLFYLVTPSTTFTPIVTYGYSLQGYRVAMLLFWCFLAAIGILYALSRLQKRKWFRIGAALCTVACVLSLLGTIRPSSDLVLSNNRPDAANINESVYYERDTTVPPAAFEPFQAAGYQLDLEIDHMLHAKTTVDLREQGLTQYGFTLYHGYQLSQVTDQTGAALRFQQDSDFVTVYADGAALQSITFVYEGFSPTFYSNGQGVFLPGYFAYYPQPGYLQMLDMESYAYNRMLLPKPVPFSLNIQGKKTYYSNLAAVGENQFAGDATGLTLLGGFYKTMDIGGTQLVYAYLDETETKIRENMTDFLAEHPYKKVLFLPEAGLDYYLACAEIDDCLLLINSYNLVLYETCNLPRHKKDIYYTLADLNASVEEYMENNRAILQYMREDGVENSLTLVDDLLQKYDVEQLIPRFEEYVADPAEERTAVEFLKSLKNEGLGE